MFDPIPGGIVCPSLVWRPSIQVAGPVLPLARQKTWHRNSGTGILLFASLQRAHEHEHLGANEWVL